MKKKGEEVLLKDLILQAAKQNPFLSYKEINEIVNKEAKEKGIERRKKDKGSKQYVKSTLVNNGLRLREVREEVRKEINKNPEILNKIRSKPKIEEEDYKKDKIIKAAKKNPFRSVEDIVDELELNNSLSYVRAILSRNNVSLKKLCKEYYSKLQNEKSD